MATKRSQTRTVSDRVAEYVNSPRLRQRVKIGKTLSCTIDGNYGTYQTRVTLARSQIKDATCTCPSDYWPCKHAHALAVTYQEAPESFVDVEKLLRTLKQKTKEELLDLLRQMILIAPSCLQALGVEGFEEPDEDEGDEERW
ncbi:MAG: SWIM zinc finger family protein [candidate division NC10 bacterium]|nr:SWIM zinc finger family protein [candidate division NC10 bacterium]